MNYKIIYEFIKDISFEIPSLESFALLEKEISKYNVNFDIKSTPFKNNIIEVNTILRLFPNQDVKNKILTEINYTTLVSFINVKEKKDLEEIILIKVPTEVYPKIYSIFVYLLEKSGIKNVKMEKEVDFRKLYNEKKGS